MQTFLLQIEEATQILLFQMLAQELGIEMKACPDDKNDTENLTNYLTKNNIEEKSQEKNTALESEKMPFHSLYYPIQTTYRYEDLLAIVAQFPEDKLWTFSDLQDETIFPETTIKKQLLDNQLYFMPNPSTLHQKILNLTSTYLTLFVSENDLGDVYVAPVSVKIDENNALEPDIIFISISKKASIGMQAITVAPDLVVEVISPANYKKLREEKKARYADFGVQEYWEIYPQKKYLKIETLVQDPLSQSSHYQIFSEAEQNGIVRSKVLEGFSLDIEKIFR
ncbi:Uma2 family endonuclease [Hugenholtzia roseola]|uniref:Uma2 family endonuclease n=1 Tax=Hugenholtzia roseola TaxID=1002 RepID=UPI00041042C7|nr:Uma2 family endonuclease [Hugenholtzia roseola]